MDTVPDIEDMVTVGKAHTLCPFYMSKDAAKVWVGGELVGTATHQLGPFPVRTGAAIV